MVILWYYRAELFYTNALRRLMFRRQSSHFTCDYRSLLFRRWIVFFQYHHSDPQGLDARFDQIYKITWNCCSLLFELYDYLLIEWLSKSTVINYYFIIIIRWYVLCIPITTDSSYFSHVGTAEFMSHVNLFTLLGADYCIKKSLKFFLAHRHNISIEGRTMAHTVRMVNVFRWFNVSRCRYWYFWISRCITEELKCFRIPIYLYGIYIYIFMYFIFKLWNHII